ncbi:19419_t:CDS:2 [Gigaspora margarita]|uniref:19419_t:CDS:1 n=1 Tax=Gigaspora margarita TaxID=4874 RepID=A0ABM8VWD8_GIGMA|nr:19419_t:CDS:2 [Gigaspora margarita]
MEKIVRQFVSVLNRKLETAIWDQNKMLNSLLERQNNRIVLDRIVEEKEEGLDLATGEEEVQQRVQNHFQKQFQRRNIKINSMSSRWQLQYGPLKEVKKEWFEELNKEVT